MKERNEERSDSLSPQGEGSPSNLSFSGEKKPEENPVPSLEGLAPARECWVMWNIETNEPCGPAKLPMDWIDCRPPPLIRPYVWVRMAPVSPSLEAPKGAEVEAGRGWCEACKVAGRLAPDGLYCNPEAFNEARRECKCQGSGDGVHTPWPLSAPAPAVQGGATPNYSADDLKKWWAAKCSKCGWRGLDRDCAGSAQDAFCPACFANGIHQVVDHDPQAVQGAPTEAGEGEKA